MRRPWMLQSYCLFIRYNVITLYFKTGYDMAMTIKTSPELWGEDARMFTEEAERNGKLPTPKLSEYQRKMLSTMLESAKNIIFPPRED